MRAVLFPGQGAQKIGMAKNFYEQFSAAREVFEAASDVTELNIAKLVFEEEDKLNSTEYTQVALVTAELAIYRALKSEGLIGDDFADVSCGLSLGEYAALAVSGAMSAGDATGLVRKRGIYMQEAVPEGQGAMAAVLGLNGERICELVSGLEGVWVANYNTDDQTVITGYKEGVANAAEVLKAAGAKRVVPLVVSGPFHSPLMEPAGKRLEESLKDISLGELKLPYVANVTGEYVYDTGVVKELLVRQVSGSVRFAQSVRNMYSKGVDTFVEIGPGKTLSKMVGKLLPEAKVMSISCVEDIKQLKL